MSIGPGPRALELALLALLALVACSPPPRGTTTGTDRTSPPPPPAPERSAEPAAPYDFEREGQFPAPAKDVVFEEDALPPPPESVDAVPFEGGQVNSSELEQEAEEAAVEPKEPSVAAPAEPSVTTPVPSEPVPMRMGFRVQLVAAADRMEAEQFAREARTRLAVAIHVDHEPPYYKVRAGDFVDRGDAIALRDRARASGYEGAWVISTRIVE